MGGAEKSKGMIGIKVAKSVQGDSRCFYMLKEDGKEEDFSAMKCLSAIEANPPYVEVESPKPKAEATVAVAKEDGKEEESKVEAKQVETSAAVEKKEEEKKESEEK